MRGGALAAAWEAGFVFWGLFVVFLLVLVAYLAWLWWVEKPAKEEGGPAVAKRNGP